VDEATRAAGTPMGSGADPSAAVPDGVASAKSGNESPTAAKAGTATPPSTEDETPRSAFGPNAHVQPEKPASAARSDTGKSADAAKAAAAKADALKAEAAKAEAKKAEAAKAEAAKAEAARVAAAKAEATRIAAAKPDSTKAGSRGWAVQLGVFGSRDNAERLAKQVRGGGFPVLVNETSGKDGKKLYWVRVGPEAEQAGAAALSAKLKAAGHRDARVVAYP
jgi:cell division septation protein DedD